MIIRQIEVESFRCFRSRVAVGPFGEGLNLVYGPNETGKSSLAAALLRGMLDSHATQGAKAEASMRPWGTNLTPQIAVEFRSGDGSYRLVKQMLTATSTASRLAQWENDTWQSILEGDQANQWLRERLSATAPGAGLSRPENRGILRFLWSLPSEGERTLEGVPAAVADQLRCQAGVTAAPSLLDGWMERAEGEWIKHFTPTGRVAVQSGMRTAQETLEGICKDLAAVRESRRQAEEAARAADEIRGSFDRLETEIADREARVEDLARKEQELAGLREQAKAALDRLDGAKEALKRLQASAKAYDKHERDRAAALEELQPLERDLAELESQRNTASQQVIEAEGVLTRARTRLAEATKAMQRGQEQEAARASMRRLGELRRALDAAEDVEQKLATLAGQRSALGHIPSEDEVVHAKALGRQIQECQARRDAAALRVRVTLEREQAVGFAGSAGDEEHAGQAGEAFEYAADGEVTLRLPGVASIHVETTRSTIAQLGEELAGLKERLGALLTEHQCPGVEDLEGRRRRDAELAAKIESLASELKAHTGSHETVRALRDAASEEAVQLQAALTALGLDEACLSKAPVADLPTLNAAAGQAQQAEADAQASYDARKHALQQLDGKLKTTVGSVQETRRRFDAADGAMKGILSTANVVDREALEAGLQSADDAVRVREAQLEEIQGKLPPPEVDPAKIRATEEHALEDARTQRQKLASERAVQEDRAASGAGLHEQEGDLAAREAAAAEALAEEQRRAAAAALVRGLLAHHRSQAVARQLPGLERRIADLLTLVTGRERSVVVGASELVPAQLTDSDHTEMDIDRLSSGTREQLDLVARIALAEVYSDVTGERQLLLLDDPLLYTDPNRHERMRQILLSAAQRLQVIIFTSHEDRYRGLVASEHQFDLAALRRATA
jgi:DNA repair exonuclease SbcCD ATPase subunit